MTASSAAASAGLGSPDEPTGGIVATPDLAEAPVIGAVPPAPETGGFWPRVFRGSAITMAGFGGAQVLRLVSVSVLTRLLDQEAYGLYRLANVFLDGLAYFTAIGSGPAVIRDHRGDDPAFLNTAWTLQVLRGIGLWVAAFLLAWPYGWFYSQRILWVLIPIVGVTGLLDSFDSVAVHWCQRHMKLAGVTIIEFLRRLTVLLITINWAVQSPTVWAFPAGEIGGCLVVLILSHVALPGPRSRLQWDRDAARSLYHFSKWIFASSVLEFVARQLDVLLLAHWSAIEQVGVYSAAVNLAEPPATLNMRLSRQVLFPIFSKTFRENPAELSRTFYRMRLATDPLHLVPLGMAIVAGNAIVHMLLGERFWDAGWMVQILCVRTATRCIYNPLSVCCFAIDALRSMSVSLVVRMVWVIVTIPAGWYGWGITGVLWAVGLSEVPVVLVLYWTLWRARVVRPSFEFMPLGLVGLGCGLGWILCRVLP